MVDIQKVKRALLKAFNLAEQPPARTSRADALDDILVQYFNKASHMPKELTLEAIVHLLKDVKPGADVSHHRVREIMDEFH